MHEYKGDTPLVGVKFDEHEGALKSFERNHYGFFDV